MGALVLSTSTAETLKAFLRRKDATKYHAPQRGGESQRVRLLVRCTSATAAGTGIGAECYPAVVVDPVSDELVADQPEFGDVWLTVISGGAAAVPVADTIYDVTMSGTHTEGTDTRPRCFAVVAGGGGVTITASTTLLSADKTLTGGWEDTGLSITVPATGQSLIWATITGLGKVSSLGNNGIWASAILARLLDSTASVVCSLDTQVVAVPVLNIECRQTVVIDWMHVSGALPTPGNTIKLQAYRSAFDSPTWTSAIISAASDENNHYQTSISVRTWT